MRTYGNPIDVEPHVALLDEVKRTAGHVSWLNSVVTELLHEGDGYSERITDDGTRTLRPRTGLKRLYDIERGDRPRIRVVG